MSLCERSELQALLDDQASTAHHHTGMVGAVPAAASTCHADEAGLSERQVGDDQSAVAAQLSVTVILTAIHGA